MPINQPSARDAARSMAENQARESRHPINIDFMSTRGITRERQVRDILANQDWVVFRPGGSLGCADLVALRAGSRPRLVQVKANKKSPYEHFRPAERALLVSTARLAGADPMLAWWPPYGQLRWFAEAEWPR